MLPLLSHCLRILGVSLLQNGAKERNFKGGVRKMPLPPVLFYSLADYLFLLFIYIVLSL